MALGQKDEARREARVVPASDESSYCSGGIYMIDGGFTAG
jgi:hypothetical protein